jgi:emfourin
MDVQRIKYERTGGFTGMRFHADFKPDELPEEQSGPLLDLLDRMDFDELPEDLTGSTAQPDQFTYTITVQTSRSEHTVILGDASAPDEMQELLRMLDRIARRRQ